MKDLKARSSAKTKILGTPLCTGTIRKMPLRKMQRVLLAALVLAQLSNAHVTLELTDNMKLPGAYANNQVLCLPACKLLHVKIALRMQCVICTSCTFICCTPICPHALAYDSSGHSACWLTPGWGSLLETRLIASKQTWERRMP